MLRVCGESDSDSNSVVRAFSQGKERAERDQGHVVPCPAAQVRKNASRYVCLCTNDRPENMQTNTAGFWSVEGLAKVSCLSVQKRICFCSFKS